MGTQESDERAGGGTGRRALLGAAVLGAGGAVLGLPGTARAAGTRHGGGHGGGVGSLPVPTVIGHRGASGYRPEHTFRLLRTGPRPGVPTSSRPVTWSPRRTVHLVLPARAGNRRHHGRRRPTGKFADRKRTKLLDGVSTTGWFTEDFTLAELKTLRATERIPANRPHNTLYDGRWEIPTFEEVLRWQNEQTRRRGKQVWIYPELKHPTYFRKLGLGTEERLARLLRMYGKDRKNSPVIIQSFEPTSIQRMSRLVRNPLAVLLSGANSRPWDFVETGDPRTTADLVTPEGLKEIASYAQGIGPTLDLIIPKDSAGRLTEPTTLVRDAHRAGLILHPYTMRNENPFLPAEFRQGSDPDAYGDVFGAFRTYFATGIDGVFTDNPDTGVLAREDFVNG
ncbi:glycerophosphoryl diester phosphodiesterase [Streptomyces lividans TK24]|nr:glycerophosphoryl diester phosphodiesterase [Streptomyces lividans TK24]